MRPQRIIAFGQLTFDGLLRQLRIKPLESFGTMNELTLQTGKLHTVQADIGEIVPCYFPVGQSIKNRAKAVEILRLAAGL